MNYISQDKCNDDGRGDKKIKLGTKNSRHQKEWLVGGVKKKRIRWREMRRKEKGRNRTNTMRRTQDLSYNALWMPEEGVNKAL